ncbi:tubulin-like doman-containing protein [Limnoglobus roseus]|uniref:non-specific serine/threonine protein kinase n=1 Tax=Limnoglobus roseus TaxID=2598579 RepID=A0A5C1A708_9BACT|nr:tubulin-like doman-containing protein [Limnoglobus roseus]QEL13622.1 serine/threonine protein kinase [Limnoglobus roseus]
MPVPLTQNHEPLPGYKLIDRLGRGGFGEVWRVEAPGGLHKAMKFVFGDLNDLEDDNIRAAEQELKALERVKNIRHPYILSLEQWKIVNGQLIIVMELAERNMWDRFKECRGLGMPGIPREELISYLLEAAEALDLMNSKYQLQHLDVKPQNLFLMYNHVKVADFGLAKAFEGGRGTVTGGVTPVYAGPETFEGKVSRYTDQYSLAIVFQELLTGTRPFNGSNTKQLVMQHLNGTPDLESLPPADRPIIGKSLAKLPEDRWPTCMDLVRALKAANAGGGSSISTAATHPNEPQSVQTPAGTAGDSARAVPDPNRPPTKPNSAERTAQKTPSGVTHNPATRSQMGVNPGPGANVNTPWPLLTPKLVTPQAANSAGGSSLTLKPTTTQLRPLIVQTAKMSDLGLATEERSGDGALVPALIVCVGHTGLVAMRTLKQILRERFGPDPLPHVRFLYIDTDPEAAALAGDLNLGEPVPANEIFVARLNRPTHYLQRDGLPSVEQWMPAGSLYKLPRNPGPANGVRAFGRLALVDHYRGITQRIRQEVEAFVTDSLINTAVARTDLGLRSNRARAYVIAGTAGGTGSGMFLDLAYLIKNEFRQIGYAKPETVGVLLVPAADKTTAKGAALGNTYAALQELQYFHGGRHRYQARFSPGEPPIADADGPFTRCNLIQLPKRNDPAEMAVTAGLVARTVFLELFTATGRVMDSIRTEAFALNKSGVPVVQTTGLYRLSWPRHELVTVATRRLGQRLIQRWTAKEASHLREPIQNWLDEQWRLRNLDVEVVVEEFNKAVRDALREEPDRVFEAFISPLRQRTPGGPRLDTEAAYEVIEQLFEVVGTPDADGEKPSSLQRVLDERHKKVVAEVEGHLSAMAVAFIEQPQYRLSGAEEVLNQILARLKRIISGLEGVRAQMRTDVYDTYGRLANVMNGLDTGRTLGVIGPRKAAVTGELLDLMEHYPNKRLKLHVLDTTLSIYRRLLASTPEFVREIALCRQRLTEIMALIAPPGEAAKVFPTGPGRMILPHGVEGLDGAADLFLGALPPQDIVDLDARLQKEIETRYRSLVGVCVKPQNTPSFLTLLATMAREFLDERLEKSDPAAVFFRYRAETAPNTPKMLVNSFEESAPDLTSISGKPQMEATILAVPLGPDGDRFRQTVESLLPGIGFIPAPLPDDIVFVREYPLLPLAELPQLAAYGREAYQQQLATEINPHTRTDLPWSPQESVPT